MTALTPEQARPVGWRIGETYFNFMEWLLVHGHAPENQNARMADPFHLSDEKWRELYLEFMKEHTKPKKI